MTDKPIEMSMVAREPAAMVQLALSQGQDLDKLEKLLELQIRYEENEAKKAYHVAMAAFKAEPPEIEKNKHVEYQTTKGKTEYKHASLDNVSKKINTALSPHGLNSTWKTTQENGSVTVTCTVGHVLGHSESTSLTAAPDTTGSKNAIQALGSTIAYLQRYTILALTGLATSDMDDDGKGSEVEHISKKQLSQITDMINDKNVDEVQFLGYMGVKATDEIPAKDFSKAMIALKKAKGREREPGEEG